MATKPAQKNGKNDRPNPNLHVTHFYPKRATCGQRAADFITKWAGSWTFIGGLIIVLIIWMLLNTVQFFFEPFDKYPFILMNLFLSCLAAFQAPIILMSQNRSGERDRAKAERDFAVNRKAEREVEDMQKDLEIIKRKIDAIAKKL